MNSFPKQKRIPLQQNPHPNATPIPRTVLILLGLLFDEHFDLRRTGLEGLYLIQSKNLDLAINILDDDNNANVQELVHQIKFDQKQEVSLCPLDAPEWVVAMHKHEQHSQ